MVLRKINFAAAWISTLLLLGHLGTMTYSMLTGWYNYSLCKGMAHAIAAAVIVHIALTLIIFFFLHDGAGVVRYGKENRRVILQRASALVIIALIHAHVKAFGFFATGEALTVNNKIFILVTEIIFFAAIFTHLSVSFSRSFMTMGFIRSEKAEKAIDTTLFVLNFCLMAVVTYALASTVVAW